MGRNLFAEAYDCPHCEAHSQQYWYQVNAQPDPRSGNYRQQGGFNVPNIIIGICQKCRLLTIWVDEEMIFPIASDAPLPNSDMPADIMVDFEEARQVSSFSPRGAAALLRLCIQKLCKELGEKGDDLNQDIASLVKKGLSPLIQKSLDAVRVIGNEAVHPGVLDLRDDKETAMGLFDLVNMIVEQMISHPKHVQAMYSKLPAGKRAAIEKRDSGK